LFPTKTELKKRLFRRAPTLITSTRIPDLGLYGETDLSPGKCEYEVFLSPDGILDKPIFLLDGFDPSDTRNIAAVYNLLNFTNSSGVTQNMGDKLRNENNFDVVIVNFPTYTNAANHVIDGGADYIERNALSFINVVELINAQKIGTEKNVIIGPSMGGLISRYALRYMETNSIDPKSRLWISFDSPHKGANVSIGLQHMFNYFAYGKANSDAIKPLVAGTLRSPAAKQMLIDHFDAHTTSIIGVNNPVVPTTGLPLVPTGCPNYRTNFQNRMNTLGFPQTTRNVAMTNGSGLGALFNSITNTPVTPGFDLINSTIDTGAVSGVNTRAVTFCEYMPNAGVNEQIVNVQIQAQIFFWITQDTFIATATQSANTNGVDSAPGGLFDIFGLTTGVAANPTLTNFLNAMRAGYFCFIPTISSMALTPPNYYAAINLGAGDTPWDATTTINPQTPFVNWYMAPTNETHVKLTAANVAFALTEIINPILSKPENTFSNLVIRNPLDNTIELYTQREISNCELTIFDVLGKVIYNKNNENLVGDYQIPFSATKGIYFLSIKNSEGKILKKLIKN
jgi:Secretion system C-terminal sorting domain